ncbi:phage minor capsid protein, partial [Staphylococcus aureus]
MAQTQETQIQQQGLPATVDSLALAVVVVYQGAETELIVGSGRLIAQTIRSPDEAPYLLGRLQTLASSIRDRVRGAVLDLATQVVDEASRNGNLTAMREIRQLAGTGTTLGPGWLPHDVNSARLMAEDLARRLDAAALRMTRFADDAYRAATTSAALAQILDKATPAEAQAQAWRELSAKGVTGFTDKAGREWNLSSYVEMATRTATQKAFNASHKDRLTQAGIVYFTISTTGRPCPLCAPWEGRVLADAGKGVATE